MSSSPFDELALQRCRDDGGLDPRIVFAEDMPRGQRLIAVRAQWDEAPGAIRLYFTGNDENLRPTLDHLLPDVPVTEDMVPAIVAELRRQFE